MAIREEQIDCWLVRAWGMEWGSQEPPRRNIHCHRFGKSHKAERLRVVRGSCCDMGCKAGTEMMGVVSAALAFA